MGYLQIPRIAISMILMKFCCSVVSIPISNTVLKSTMNSSQINLTNYTTLNMTFDANNTIGSEEKSKTRNKRQASSGAGKFTEAANTPQIKVLRTFLQMFGNMFSPAPIGGTHPFHPEAVKPIIKLYKHRIVNYFFPDVGESKVRK